MRRSRKKYKRPKKPFDKLRIPRERKLLNEYGLKNKRELWKFEEILRKFRRRARELIAIKDEKKIKELIDKLVSIGVLAKGSTLDDVLDLTVNDILNRRLQTIVYKKGLARTIKEARQLIVHGHIVVDDRVIRYPSFIVPVELEDKIKNKLNVKK